VTDQYTKAVGQLGSDKAPVRLGALYALERFAQDNPAHRQTTVNVICAYLRMPFSPTAPASEPVPEPGEGAQQPAAGADIPALAGNGDTWQQEKQVRLTAQRVLSEHLRRTPPQTQPSADPAVDRFWPGIRLDLTGATLTDFSLSGAVLAEAMFDGATFTGDAMFDGATFTGDAWFGEATFTGGVWFDGATFTGDARFGEATFTGGVWFDGATFTGDAWFNTATFTSAAWFNRATFTSGAWFNTATFTGDAWFNTATFTSAAVFGEATFTSGARFGEATFTSGKEAASFDGSHVLAPDAHHVWPEGWCTGETGDGEHTVVRVSSSPGS